MSDQFVSAISGELTTLGYTNVVIQAVPQAKEWHDLPLVQIVSESKDVSWMAFNHVNITNVYTVSYVDNNLSVNVQDPNVDKFVKDMTATFQGVPASLTTAGAWNCVCEPAYDCDKSVYGDMYTVCMVRIKISWIVS